jgi:hypothetical protein
MALDKENAASVTKSDYREKLSRPMDTMLPISDADNGAIDAVTELAERSATQVSRMMDYSFRVSQEATRHATQNLDVLMQCGTIVAEGWQTILREWISATQETAQKNMSDLQELMQCRSMDAFFSRQSNILRDRIEAIQNSNARISEVSAQVANETAKRISEMTSSINFSTNVLDEAQGNLRKAGAEMARVDRAAD